MRGVDAVASEAAGASANVLTDPARLEQLHATGLLEAGGIPSWDRLIRIAARQARTPTALVSLVEAHRQVFVSQLGVPEPWASRGQTPLSYSICRHVVAGDAPLVIPDTRVDPLLRDNLAVAELGVSAYAGFPVRAPDGHVLGSFCVIDARPRCWTADELAVVEDLSVAAEAEIALRLANGELRLAAGRMRSVLDSMQDAFVSIDAMGTVANWNAAAERLFGYSTAEATGRRVADLILPAADRAAHDRGLARIRAGAASTLAGQRLTLTAVDRTGREFPIEMALQVRYERGQPMFHAFLHDISPREAARQELETERTFLQGLLDSLDTGVVACDAEGRPALRNRALRSLDPGGTDRLYQPDGRTLLPPGETPLARAFAGEQVHGQPLVVHAPNGRWRRFLVNGRPIDAADGRRLGAVAALHDVTEQHRHEVLRDVQLAVAQALADATSAEQAAVSTIAAVATALGWTCGEFWCADDTTGTISRIGSWTAPGHDLRAVTGDQTFTVPRGTGLAGIVWDTAAELWIPEVADDPRTVARRAQAREAGLHTAIGLPVRSDGRVLGVLLFFSSSVDEPDDELMTMLDGVCAHLGRHFERRRAEDLELALTATRRAFDRIISQVNDDVWTVRMHPDGSVTSVYAGPDATGIIGGRLPAGADMASTVAARVHPDDRASFTRFHTTVASGEPADAEVRVAGLDGITRWVWMRAAPRFEDGELFIDGISTDVTERHRLADEREQLLTDQRDQVCRLRELDRMKDELVALVSHELRNPLSTIRGYTEIMLGDPDLAGDHRHLMAVIDKHSAHMQGLVDDLLDLARIEAGQMSVDISPVALIRLVGDSVQSLQIIADAKHLTVTVDVPHRLTVHADAARMRQVLDNLLSNAVKYTLDGGLVTVAARDDGTGRPGAGSIVVTVTDSGIGIPAEQYPYLFNRFFRASNALTQGIKGTGLGLAISKAIMEAHAGTITAHPAAAGPGTTFTLTLPGTHPGDGPGGQLAGDSGAASSRCTGEDVNSSSSQRSAST